MVRRAQETSYNTVSTTRSCGAAFVSFWAPWGAPGRCGAPRAVAKPIHSLSLRAASHCYSLHEIGY